MSSLLINCRLMKQGTVQLEDSPLPPQSNKQFDKILYLQ